MKSVLVIGMGSFGKRLAEKMQELGNDVMVMDRNVEIINELAKDFYEAQIGDLTNESVIEAIGVDKFDIIFVTIGEDLQSSMVITLLLKRHGAKKIVAKASSDVQAELLKQIGADEIVIPEMEIAEELAVRYNAKNIIDYIKLTKDYSIYEICIMPWWVNKSIAEIAVRAKYRINIIAIKKGEELIPAPGAEYVFNADDHIVVIGRIEDINKIK